MAFAIVNKGADKKLLIKPTLTRTKDVRQKKESLVLTGTSPVGKVASRCRLLETLRTKRTYQEVNIMDAVSYPNHLPHGIEAT